MSPSIPLSSVGGFVRAKRAGPYPGNAGVVGHGDHMGYDLLRLTPGARWICSRKARRAVPGSGEPGRRLTDAGPTRQTPIRLPRCESTDGGLTFVYRHPCTTHKQRLRLPGHDRETPLDQPHGTRR